MKTCAKCLTSKVDSEFHRRGTGLQPYCKPCKAQVDDSWYRANHKQRREITNRNRKTVREVIWAYKTNTPCVDCGKCFHHSAMDFDHLKDKKHNVSEMTNSGNSVEAIMSEIAKCELVCACCHRLRTWNRNHSGIV